MTKETNVADFISNLGAGVTEKVLSRVLSDTATAVLLNGGKRNGKVSLELTFDRMSEDSEYAVKVNTKLSFKKPTSKGSSSEDMTHESIFFIDPQKGLVDAPPKPKEDLDHKEQHHSMGSAMPVSHRSS